MSKKKTKDYGDKRYDYRSVVGNEGFYFSARLFRLIPKSPYANVLLSYLFEDFWDREEEEWLYSEDDLCKGTGRLVLRKEVLKYLKFLADRGFISWEVEEDGRFRVRVELDYIVKALEELETRDRIQSEYKSYIERNRASR